MYVVNKLSREKVSKMYAFVAACRSHCTSTFQTESRKSIQTQKT